MKAHNEHVITAVLKATLELLVSRGPRGWNMDDLAALSGISKRTLYKIVVSREAVIERVVLAELQHSMDAILDLVATESDAAHALGKLTRGVPDIVCSIETIGRINEIELQYPALKDRIKELQLKRSEQMQAVLKNGVTQGVLRSDIDPEFIARLQFGVVEICVDDGYSGQELYERLTQAMDLVCRGIIANPAALIRYQEALG